MADDLKLLFPPKDLVDHPNDHQPLRPNFAVVGLVASQIQDDAGTHIVRDVQVTLQSDINGKVLAQENAQNLRLYKRPDHLVWAVVLGTDVHGKTPVTLTVTALGEESAPIGKPLSVVGLYVQRLFGGAPPTIDWPDMDGYQLSADEEDYFVASGTSDSALTQIQLGTGGPTNAEWSMSDQTWWATFDPLMIANAGTGLNLSVSNQDTPTPATRPVVV
jgi:hypothetical protein